MNVTLRQLHAFIAVAQTGSFTLAAERLFVTQSALSGLIRELESSLGLRLFDRSTRRLRLSVMGQELYPQIEKILHDLEGVVSEAGNLKALQRGKVRIAVPQLLACTLLPEVMSGFKARHPGVQLRMVDCAVESVMARVFSGEVDIGIGPERETNSDIEAAELFTLPFMVVLPPGHPLAAQEQVVWQDLSAQPLVTLQGQFTELLVSDAGDAARDLQQDSFMQVTFMTSALALVRAGLGITLCLPYARLLVEQNGLVMRPLVAPVVRRSFWTFTRKGRALSPAAQAFLEELRAQLGRNWE
ncbi:HTH-type transcriptional regulator CynR [uncultured Comamonas sp.]|nr:HTH-type transcriptional regulator CynR [uncultured Comamonas sp.]